MPVTVGDIVNALEALGGEAHYREITRQVLQTANGPFPADPQASVRARLQERCSDFKAYKGQFDHFESKPGTGIWRFRKFVQIKPVDPKFNEDNEIYEAYEGKLIPISHLKRERDPLLVKRFKANLADLRCEVCRINFTEVYGALGSDYIEAHHRVPISQMEVGVKTSIEDLAALCANCHRIIHKNYPTEVEDLAAVLAEPGGFSDYMEATRNSRVVWKDAVCDAIRRIVTSRQSNKFTRKLLIEMELATIIDDVGSKGETPEQTLSRVLQELRTLQVIEFIDNEGTYRLK